MKVTLPILHQSDVSNLLNGLGIDNTDDFENKDMIFYSINAIKCYYDNEKQTTIYSNGDNFVCDLPLNEVEKLIDESRLK